MPSRQEQTADAVVMCPQSKVGTLIGFKGSNVNEVMRRTGARIQIVQDNIPAGVLITEYSFTVSYHFQ